MALPIRHAVDRWTLILSVVALVFLMATLLQDTVGVPGVAVWAISIISVGFLLARLLRWLRRDPAYQLSKTFTPPDTIEGRWAWYVLDAERRQRLPHWEWENEDEFVIAAAQRTELRQLYIRITGHAGVTFSVTPGDAGREEVILHVNCRGDRGYDVYRGRRTFTAADARNHLGHALDGAGAAELTVRHLPHHLR